MKTFRLTFYCLALWGGSLFAQSTGGGASPFENQLAERYETLLFHLSRDVALSHKDAIDKLRVQYGDALKRALQSEGEGSERTLITEEMHLLMTNPDSIAGSGAGGPKLRKTFLDASAKLDSKYKEEADRLLTEFAQSLASLLPDPANERDKVLLDAYTKRLDEIKQQGTSEILSIASKPVFEPQEVLGTPAQLGNGVRKILRIPEVEQQRNYCAPACLASVSQYYGRFVDQETAAELCSQDSERGRGTGGEALLNAMHRLGFEFTQVDLNEDDPSRGKAETSRMVETAGFEMIKREIDRGRPIIFNYETNAGGHVSLIVGYETGTGENRVFVQDPYRPDKKEALTSRELGELWVYKYGSGYHVVAFLIEEPPRENAPMFRILPPSARLTPTQWGTFAPFLSSAASTTDVINAPFTTIHPDFVSVRRDVAREDQITASSRTEGFAAETGIEILKGEVAMGKPGLAISGEGRIILVSAYNSEKQELSIQDLATGEEKTVTESAFCESWVRRVDDQRFLEIIYVATRNTAPQTSSQDQMTDNSNAGNLIFDGTFQGEKATVPSVLQNVKIDWVEVIKEAKRILVGTENQGVYAKDPGEDWYQLRRESVKAYLEGYGWDSTVLTHSQSLIWNHDDFGSGEIPDVKEFTYGRNSLLAVDASGTLHTVPETAEFDWGFQKWAEDQSFVDVAMSGYGGIYGAVLAVNESGRLFAFSTRGPFQLPPELEEGVLQVESRPGWLGGSSFAVLKKDGTAFLFSGKLVGNQNPNRQTFLMEWSKSSADTFGGKMPVSVRCNDYANAFLLDDGSWAVFQGTRDFGSAPFEEQLSAGPFRFVFCNKRSDRNNYFIAITGSEPEN